MRARDPEADHRPRTSKEDPNFLEKFYKASRLHYIGMWNQRYQELLLDLGASPPLGPAMADNQRCVMHIDMDFFFAQVSTLGRPDLVGAPVAVSWSDSTSEGASGSHGEISCANYEARARGVSAGMFIGRAKELCPELITIPYEFDKYTEAQALLEQWGRLRTTALAPQRLPITIPYEFRRGLVLEAHRHCITQLKAQGPI
ncbi:hypothetical protein T484DRAFT_1921789 [Baffinella frigidus]|nr:hypothetical protein T484DRAFT_1921789 [Cryptophyta sp. CCMP2293]